MSANRPPSREAIETWASRGTYAKSLTPLKTLSRPVSRNVSPPTATVQPPESGSTIHSLSPVSKVCQPPAGSSSTRRLEWPQSADSGVTSTA